MSSKDDCCEIVVIPATPPRRVSVFSYTSIASDDGSTGSSASYSPPLAEYLADSPTSSPTGWYDPAEYTVSNASPPFLTSPFLDSFVNMDLSSAGYAGEELIAGEWTGYLHPQRTHADDLAQISPVLLQLPLVDSQAMGHHGATSSATVFDDAQLEEDILGDMRPLQPSALFSYADPSVSGGQSVPSGAVAVGQGLDFGATLLPPPAICSLRVDPWQSDLERGSLAWPDVWRKRCLADGRLSYLDTSVSTLDPGMHSPVSPSPSASSFLSAPSPGSSAPSSIYNEPQPDGLGPSSRKPRLVVGSHANAHAARQRRKRPARFQCGRCEATFTARHNLTHHENAHDGIRPYACPRCAGTFTTPGTATRHSKTCKVSLRPMYARESSA